MKTVMYGLSQPINTLATRESLFKPEDFGWDLWEPICGHLLVEHLGIFELARKVLLEEQR